MSDPEIQPHSHIWPPSWMGQSDLSGLQHIATDQDVHLVSYQDLPLVLTGTDSRHLHSPSDTAGYFTRKDLPHDKVQTYSAS